VCSLSPPIRFSQAIADTKALLGYLSDPDEAGESSTQLQNGAVTSTMDLVQALNDLLESDEFIEYRGDLPVPTGRLQTLSSIWMNWSIE
jgi:hypothetical protein